MIKKVCFLLWLWAHVIDPSRLLSFLIVCLCGASWAPVKWILTTRAEMKDKQQHSSLSFVQWSLSFTDTACVVILCFLDLLFCPYHTFSSSITHSDNKVADVKHLKSLMAHNNLLSTQWHVSFLRLKELGHSFFFCWQAKLNAIHQASSASLCHWF